MTCRPLHERTFHDPHLPLLPLLALLAACGADGAPEAPTPTPGVSITGEVRAGVVGKL